MSNLFHSTPVEWKRTRMTAHMRHVVQKLFSYSLQMYEMLQFIEKEREECITV